MDFNNFQQYINSSVDEIIGCFDNGNMVGIRYDRYDQLFFSNDLGQSWRQLTASDTLVKAVSKVHNNILFVTGTLGETPVYKIDPNGNVSVIGSVREAEGFYDVGLGKVIVKTYRYGILLYSYNDNMTSLTYDRGLCTESGTSEFLGEFSSSSFYRISRSWYFSWFPTNSSTSFILQIELSNFSTINVYKRYVRNPSSKSQNIYTMVKMNRALYAFSEEVAWYLDDENTSTDLQYLGGTSSGVIFRDYFTIEDSLYAIYSTRTGYGDNRFVKITDLSDFSFETVSLTMFPTAAIKIPYYDFYFLFRPYSGHEYEVPEAKIVGFYTNNTIIDIPAKNFIPFKNIENEDISKLLFVLTSNMAVQSSIAVRFNNRTLYPLMLNETNVDLISSAYKLNVSEVVFMDKQSIKRSLITSYFNIGQKSKIHLGDDGYIYCNG